MYKLVEVEWVVSVSYMALHSLEILTNWRRTRSAKSDLEIQNARVLQSLCDRLIVYLWGGSVVCSWRHEWGSWG